MAPLTGRPATVSLDVHSNLTSPTWQEMAGLEEDLGTTPGAIVLERASEIDPAEIPEDEDDVEIVGEGFDARRHVTTPSSPCRRPRADEDPRRQGGPWKT